jgi:hypothetical protein
MTKAGNRENCACAHSLDLHPPAPLLAWTIRRNRSGEHTSRPTFWLLTAVREVGARRAQVATELAGQVKLVKVNVDDSPKIQQRFEVQAIPTLIALRRGQVAARRSGAAPAADLRAWVEAAIKS